MLQHVNGRSKKGVWIGLISVAAAGAQIPPGILGGIIGGMAANTMSLMDVPGEAHQYILDSSSIRPDLFRKVALNLAFHELAGDSDRPCFEYRDAVKWQARLCFDVVARAWLKSHTQAVAPLLMSDSIRIPQDQIVGQIQIFGSANENPGYPLALWFLSAYNQELFPQGFSNAQYFVEPERKSLAGYRWRNLVSMGWGTQYGARKNPFISHTGLAIGLGYALDLLSGFMVLAGPFIGHDHADRVVIPIIGVSTSAFFHLLMFNSGNFQPSFNLLNSGYAMPRALIEPKSGLKPP